MNEALKQEARSLGIDLGNDKHINEIAARTAKAREVAAQQTTATDESSVYAQIERVVVGIGNTLVLLLMLLLSNIALPVGIVGLAAVEIARVADGVSLFDAHHAGLMAVVAVAVYMLLLVIKSHIQIVEHGTLEKQQFSLRLVAQRVGYVLGFSKDWKARSTTPVERLERAITSVGYVIIVLGTLGSMRGMFGQQSGAWHEALINILTQSTLTEFVSYLGGFIFTAALLAATHWAVGYAYERYAKLRPSDVADQSAALEAAALEAEADYIKLQIARERSKREAKKDKPVTANLPLTSITSPAYPALADQQSTSMQQPASELFTGEMLTSSVNGNGAHHPNS